MLVILLFKKYMSVNIKYCEDVLFNTGDFLLPKCIINILRIDILGSKNSYWYIDGWSLIHIISGIIFGYIYIKLNYDINKYYFKMFIFHTIWELWQILVGMSNPFTFYGKNSLTDTIIDTLCFLFGAFIIKQFYH
jgi:hypothetical protein